MGSKGGIIVWDLLNGESTQKIFPPDKRTSIYRDLSIREKIVAVRHDIIFIWDFKSESYQKIFRANSGIRCAAISGNGKFVITGMNDYSILLWDLEGNDEEEILKKHKNRVVMLSKDYKSKLIVSCSIDHTLMFWDFKSGELIRKLGGHSHEIHSLCISHDGKHLISAGAWRDPDLHIWDINKGKLISKIHIDQDLRSNKITFIFIKITLDGKRLITVNIGRLDKALRLWDLEKLRCETVIDLDLGPINCVDLSPDEKIIIRGGRTLNMLDLKNKEHSKSFWDHMGEIYSVCITLDGRYLLSGSNDTTIRFWDLQSGLCLKIFEGHQSTVKSIRMSPDGKRFISGSVDGTIRVWDLSVGNCIAAYTNNIQILCLSELSIDGSFAFGTGTGEVIIINPHNFPMDAPIITAHRQWIKGKIENNSHWSEDITFICHWCHGRYKLSTNIYNKIMELNNTAGISSQNSPCLNLPKTAWDEPELLSECPKCHKPLKYNPFIVDNRERY